MKVIPTALEGVLALEPKVHVDERGWFIESYNQHDFDAAVGYSVRFVQDNQSYSKRGVLRGLHYQLPPHAQGKLVRVLAGRVFDVAVDLRRSSATFGRWVGETLSATNHRQLWIPPGCAHGFAVLGREAIVAYKVTAHHEPAASQSLRWDDDTIGIVWPDVPYPRVVSDKDATSPTFEQAPCFD